MLSVNRRMPGPCSAGHPADGDGDGDVYGTETVGTVCTLPRGRGEDQLGLSGASVGALGCLQARWEGPGTRAHTPLEVASHEERRQRP